MELTDNSSVYVGLLGNEDFQLSAGEKFRIQKYVEGEIEDVLENQTVPAGKAWRVQINVEVTVTNV